MAQIIEDDSQFDALLRGAMKSLDGDIPAGYFEALPNRILPRLEATSMHTDTGTDTSAPSDDQITAPPQTDDSGLHDIRNLAETTKRRLSKKVTAHPANDDVLASSSGSWRGIALPEPAKMVSLPELAELPSRAEIKAKDKLVKADLKAAAKVAASAEPTASTSTLTVSAVLQAPTVAPITVARPAARAPANNNARTFALVGIGLAAAAGIALFVKSSHKAAPADAVAMDERAPAAAAAPAAAHLSVEPITPPAAPVAPPIPSITDTSPPVPPVPEPAAPVGVARTIKKAPAVAKPNDAGEKAVVAAVPGPTAADPVKAKPTSGDPSFDDLLKEAGVQEGGAKKAAAPKLDKKALSTDDIMHGMGALTSKAQACYKGTQGTAAVKLTVAPSGQVTKVTVGGPFAGTPEGACVAALAQSASFPAWDGGPQTVHYSYLLSE